MHYCNTQVVTGLLYFNFGCIDNIFSILKFLNMLCHITFIIKFRCRKIININYWLMNIYIAVLLLFNFFSSILHMVWFYYCIRVDSILHNTALLCYDKSSMIII